MILFKKLKNLPNWVLQYFGYKIINVRLNKSKYFNTGRLTSLQENSVELYNAFYKDKNALSEYYDDYRKTFYRNIIHLVKKNGLNLNYKSVLDVGCGIGFLLNEIQRSFKPKKLTGFDFSNKAILASQKKFSAMNFRVHNIYKRIPQKYDCIFCTEVLEHLVNPEMALKNLLQGLKRGGFIVLTVPNGRLDTINEHINFWSPESWKSFLSREAKGMLIKTDTFFNHKINIALLKKPLK